MNCSAKLHCRTVGMFRKQRVRLICIRQAEVQFLQLAACLDKKLWATFWKLCRQKTWRNHKCNIQILERSENSNDITEAQLVQKATWVLKASALPWERAEELKGAEVSWLLVPNMGQVPKAVDPAFPIMQPLLFSWNSHCQVNEIEWHHYNRCIQSQWEQESGVKTWKCNLET